MGSAGGHAFDRHGRGRPSSAIIPPAGRASRQGRLSVCLYTPSVDPSGMGSHMIDLAVELRGCAEVSVLCWGTAKGRAVLDRADRLGVTTGVLPHPRDPAFGTAVEQFLAARPADVFHIHVGSGRENFDGARAARRAGVRAVVQTQHQPWLFRHPRKRVRFFRGMAPVDRLIAVSEGVRESYLGIGLAPDRITTVPNGIVPRGPGPGRARARQALGLDPDQLVVMNVGRLLQQKGQCWLVEAMPELAARFPDLAVVIVGEGYLRGQLTERAAELGVGEHLRLPGHRADARMLLDAADVFVLPSRQEGMPLAAIEAMDTGLPVIATDVVGTAEVVADRETGVLVPPGDVPALGTALVELLADPELRARYGAAGRRRYEERFTAQRMAAATLAVYRELLGGSPEGRTGRSPAGSFSVVDGPGSGGPSGARGPSLPVRV